MRTASGGAQDRSSSTEISVSLLQGSIPTEETPNQNQSNAGSIINVSESASPTHKPDACYSPDMDFTPVVQQSPTLPLPKLSHTKRLSLMDTDREVTKILQEMIAHATCAIEYNEQQMTRIHERELYDLGRQQDLKDAAMARL